MTDILATYIDRMDDEVFLKDCINQGVTIFRQTMGYKTLDTHFERLKKLKELGVKVMMDFQGSKPRLGNFQGKVRFHDEIILGNGGIPLNCNLSVKKGDTILMKDGRIKLKVRDLNEDNIVCDVIESNDFVTFNSSLNVPGMKFKCIGERELKGLSQAGKLQPDYIALSFVSCKQDILDAKKLIQNNKIKIIAKIETKSGVQNIKEILEEADGIMVARGDLALQTSFEELGVLQDKLMYGAKMSGKIAFVATDNLGSLKCSNLPSRSEIIDNTLALKQGSKALWLGPELAHSNNYFLALDLLKRIIKVYELSLNLNR